MNHEKDTAVRLVLDGMERMHRRIYMIGWLPVLATLASYVWRSRVTAANL